MILIFDTETSNLPQKNLPLNHPAQARIVQFAALLLDRDFKERASFCALIKPSDWIIQPGAQAAHGITQEECIKHGIDINIVLHTFDAMLSNSEILVAHNIKFDKELLETERSVNGGVVYNNDVYEFCTMMLMTDVCKLPGRYNGYKWPKLQEAYKYVTGSEFEGAHGALADCRATATVFKWLIDRKHVSVPQLVLA